MSLQNYPISRSESIVIQEFEKELLIYDLLNNKIFCLNQTAKIVWQNCDGRKTIAEIALILKKNSKETVDEDLVWLAMEQLKNENLLEIKVPLPLTRLKRREVIKKIGLTSMIALPIITNLVAPKAIEAQSVANCVCPNNVPGACQEGGTFSLGCFTIGEDCFATADNLGLKLCCHGFDGISFDIQTRCCSVSCFEIS